GGLPDSHMPGCERTLYSVIGFQPPQGEGDAVTSPVGGDASRLAAIPISEGFNLGYCRARPGHGPMMHNHDTNETFIPMTGTWRASWENEKGEVEHVDLDPLDVVSFPPGAIRQGRAVAPKSRPGQALRGPPGSSPGSRAPQGDGNESVRNALAISLLPPRRSRAHPRHETSRRRNPAVGDDDLAGDEARGGR